MCEIQKQNNVPTSVQILKRPSFLFCHGRFHNHCLRMMRHPLTKQCTHWTRDNIEMRTWGGGGAVFHQDHSPPNHGTVTPDSGSTPLVSTVINSFTKSSDLQINRKSRIIIFSTEKFIGISSSVGRMHQSAMCGADTDANVCSVQMASPSFS